MAQLTRAAFLSKFQGIFADNITREISEEDMRTFAEDIKDSFINGLEYTPSSSFAGLTGDPLDNQQLVIFRAGIIDIIRAGVPADYNNLKKIYDALVAISAQKANVVHTHTMSQITGLLAALADIDGGTAATALTALRLRRQIAQQWADVNPIPRHGELCIELDTRKAKVGDGVTAYSSLPYWFDTSGTTAFKGWYTNEASIIAAYPTASIGDYAINGGTQTFWIWDADTTSWVNSGQASPSIIIDNIAADGSTNAAQSGDLFAKYSFLMNLITALTDEVDAIEIPTIPSDEWTSFTPASGNVPINFAGKKKVFFSYEALGNYTWTFANETSDLNDVVELRAEVTLGTGINSHVVTLPGGFTHQDDSGRTITQITIDGEEEDTITIYGDKRGAIWKWFWKKEGGSDITIIDGGTT